MPNSFDDIVISNFTSGAGNQTWPLRILTELRFGLSPEVNATATMMLAKTMIGLGLGAAVVYRAARREGGSELDGLTGTPEVIQSVSSQARDSGIERGAATAMDSGR